jgi:capsular polysaccharide biosynthesis protein
VTPQIAGYTRTAVTLGVLGLLLVFGVVRGLDAVSDPFPVNEEPPVCVDSTVTAGDILRAPGVTVSVINAGRKTGLARTTLDDLKAEGFAAGEVANVPDKSVQSAEIWSPDGRTAAVRLLETYLGGTVRVVKRQSSVAGITVVVGDQFPGVQEGRLQIKVHADGTVCGPAELS